MRSAACLLALIALPAVVRAAETRTYGASVVIERSCGCVTGEVSLVACDGVAEYRLPRTAVPADATAVRLRLDFAKARAGEDGYFVIPPGDLGRFTCTSDARTAGPGGLYMPVFGMKTPRVAFVAIGTGMCWSFREEVTAKDGEYAAELVWCEDLDAPYEDFSFRFVFLDGEEADYSGMARAYRRHQLARGACRPLADRAKERPALAYAAVSPEVRIRQAWKPVPSPVANQVVQNEPPVGVHVTFDRVSQFVDALKAEGVERAELCLVGWNRGGHDGAYPQIFPVEPLLGGEAKLREAVRHAQAAGYQIVAHGNHRDAYMIADTWDAEYVREKNPDGTLRPPKTTWGGGGLYTICQKRAYERFAIRQSAEVAALGFAGLYYLDVASCTAPTRCDDPRHPMTKRVCRDYEAAILSLYSRAIGGVASEGACDAYMDVLDSVLTVRWTKPFAAPSGLVTEQVPFWELVYNGICLSTPFRSAMNTTEQEDARRLTLKLAEFGGRPTYYIHSRFRENGKAGAMGDRDLVLTTDDDLRHAARRVREGAEEFVRRSHLQFAFMDRHERLAEGIFRITYSTGDRMYCNYTEKTVTADGVGVPAVGWTLEQGQERR